MKKPTSRIAAKSLESDERSTRPRIHRTPIEDGELGKEAMAANSGLSFRQREVRRYGASLGLVALALLLSRYVTPDGASSPLVLLGATAAVAYYGGKWPALLATLTAAAVNAAGIGISDLARLVVETTMILLLGVVLSFRALRTLPDVADGTGTASSDARVEQTLPLVSAAHRPPRLDAPPSHSPHTLVPGDEAVEREASPPTVLVIHGNAVLRLALRSTLTGLGYRVKDAANIGQASELVRQVPLNAVVFDVGRIDDVALASIESLRGAANQNSPAKCQILVLASVDADDDRELALAAGADLVLKKPIDTAGIAARLREGTPLPIDSLQRRVGLGASP
jgi:CheY-like chemotaxis protein